MLIQFKDYTFLLGQSHIEPTINDEMLELANEIVEIPDDQVQYTSEGWFKYGGWVWDTDWFVVLEPSKLLNGEPYINMIDYQNTDFVKALETTTMPDTLQYIRMGNSQINRDITINVSHYKVLLTPAQRDTYLGIKLSTTSEYNLTTYLGQRLSTIRPDSTRVYEDTAVEVVKNIVQAFRIAFDKKQQPDNVFFSENNISIRFKHGFSETSSNFNHTELYTRGLERDDIDYNTVRFALNNLISLALYQSKYVDVSSASMVSNYDIMRTIGFELQDLLKEDEFIITSNGGSYKLPLSLKEELTPNLPIHTCPVFGIKSVNLRHPHISADQVSPVALALIHKSFQDGDYRGVLLPNYGVDDEAAFHAFLDKIGNRFPESYRTAERGVLHNGNWMSPLQREMLETRSQAYQQFNLEQLTSNRFSYNGKNFYTDDETIQEYDFEAEIQFFGESDDLHLGVELEVDKGGESHYNASIVQGILGWNHTYIMHDGSLSDGFEIATQPMTLDYHMSLEQRYRDAFGVLSTLGYKSHNTSTCGLHIHFDRNHFGRSRQTQSIKAGYLALIMEKNWEKFVQFSRRSYDRMDQWAKKLDLVADIYADDTDEDISTKFGNKYGDGDKYVALNTAHSHTYELRIFRGTLKPETYLATLQFVDNLVRVAKDCPSLAKAQQITFADIINYNPHTHLVDYITSRGILTREYIEYKGE